MLPILSITAPCEGALTINGAAAGEAPCVMPVSPTGDVRLLFLPYDDKYLPSAHRVPLHLGRALGDGLRRAHITQWPDGYMEVSLRVPAVPGACEVIDQRAFDGGEATLYRYEGGMRLLVFNESGLALTAEERGATFGEIRAPEGDDSTLLLHTAVPEGEGLRVIRGARELLTLRGRRIQLSGDCARVRVTRELGDTAGHAETTTFLRDGEGYAQELREITRGEERPLSPAETARALSEALLLGLDEEAMRCITPAARESLSPFRLRAFMMPFERWADALHTPGMPHCEILGLVHDETEDLATVKVFAYEYAEDGLIANIRGYIPQ